jgi:tetratricopeptide (TPR) repeat protein
VSGASIGWILFHARRYDEATRELHSVLAVQPDNAWAHWILGFVLITKGQPEEAIPLLERTVSLMDRSPGSLELLATAYARAGRRSEALGLIDEIEKAPADELCSGLVLLSTPTWDSATTSRRLPGLSGPTRKSQTFCNSSKCILSLIRCAAILVLPTWSAASGLTKPANLICHQAQRVTASSPRDFGTENPLFS